MNDSIWVSGEWTGFYLEPHHARRGWMHLYLEFQSPSGDSGILRGEGTDYVGPWNLAGEYSPKDLKVSFSKHYVGRHVVRYEGTAGDKGIVGRWSIGGLTGEGFHIWPQSWGQMDELYMAEDMQEGISDGKKALVFPGFGVGSAVRTDG